MRGTKAEMIEFMDGNFDNWNYEHNMKAQQAPKISKSVLSFYRPILQGITNCNMKDIVEDDAGTGVIQGYRVDTSCPDQEQDFVQVDCAGINVDGGGSRRLWSAALVCKRLRSEA